MSESNSASVGSETDIAVVGVAAHLPGATSPSAYWANLRGGVESILARTESQLVDAGVPQEHLRRPEYVRAAAVLDGVHDFDPEFFGLSPKEAGIMDPQHRHFLMATWEAMEDAGHVPESFDGAVGVFAGCGMGSYFTFNVLSNPDLVRDVGFFLLRHTGNDKDFLSTRASYCFDLNGPSVNVQTACSTSLVATHLAVQHLLSGECDMALAGGVTIETPHGHGYLYSEGEILSPDGHCRAFDHRSAGTVFGSGVGMLALRRLDDALADRDQVYAVIRGTAVNNDGSQKDGYLAPSVDGQAACVTEALAVAEVDPATIDYVECHGTGTPMGDPIEVSALTRAFESDTPRDAECRIGSVKTNIGHLDTAAGVAGLIKVCLALRNGELPASLHFEKANPNLELDESPFVVNAELTPWPRSGRPRRAGVNSLGVGGTNAFAVLEEAPEPRPTASQRRWRLLPLSARSSAALGDASRELADHLLADPSLDLADVSWTLQVGRAHFPERQVVVSDDHAGAARLLNNGDPKRVFRHHAAEGPRSLAFMFPGGGSQYQGMAADLHDREPVFAGWVDRGLQELSERHGLDLAHHLLGGPGSGEDLSAMTHQLPLIFIVEYAMAMLLLDWGLEPTALVGHSLGENTAACVSGTMDFSECLGLVVLRGRLMDEVDGGALAVNLPPGEVLGEVEELGLDIAVLNGPELTVVSGSAEGLAEFDSRLRTRGVEPLPVPVTTPVHSRLLEPVLDRFGAYVREMALRPPTIPWVSNTTGTWITADEATDPDYWVRHLRSTVRFSDCIETLSQDAGRTLLEVGPGRTLSSVVRLSTAFTASHAAIPTMRHADEQVDDNAALLEALGRMWAVGHSLDTDRLFADCTPSRVTLPTYPFQKQTYFIPPGTRGAASDDQDMFPAREADEARWTWKPVWRSSDREDPEDLRGTWLVFADSLGVADAVTERLRRAGNTVVVVRAGDSYREVSENEYLLSPEMGSTGYDALMRDLVRLGRLPDRIAHLWLLAVDEEDFRVGSSFFHRNQELGFQSLVFLAQAWAASGVQHTAHLHVGTAGAQLAPGTTGDTWPSQSTVLGPVGVIPREIEGMSASTFDLDTAALREHLGVPDHTSRTLREQLGELVVRGADRGGADVGAAQAGMVDALVAELTAPPGTDVVALRGDRRYVRGVRRLAVPEGTGPPLRRGGAVLITGGLGGIGLSVAAELVDSVQARVALLSRSPFPPRSSWYDLARRLGPEHPTVARINQIERIEAAGGEVMVLRGDVTDPEDVRAVLAEVRERFGSVDGIVHAAGVIDDALLVSKSQTDMEDVLAPKVYGTLVLEEATAADDLSMFLVFSSTSTVTNPTGQVDYVAANAFLNAFAESRHHMGAAWVQAIDWGVWAEVGMAAGSVEQMAPHSEDSLVAWSCTHPLLGKAERTADGRIRVSATWDTSMWVFDDHRTEQGEALMPGSGYFDLVAGVLGELDLDGSFEVRDLTFLRPLAVPDGESVDVEVLLDPTDEGYSFTLRRRVELESAAGEGEAPEPVPGWLEVGRAQVLLAELDPLDPVDLGELTSEVTRSAPRRTHQQDHLRFGPHWDVVRDVHTGGERAVADLELAAGLRADLADHPFHPGLIDLATGFAMDLIEGYTGDRLWVPVTYRRVRLMAPLEPVVHSVAQVRTGSSESQGFATFDVLVCNPDGDVLMVVDGFTVKRIEDSLDLASSVRPPASDVQLDAPGTGRHLSLSELALRHNLGCGIRPVEGRRMLSRVTSAREEPVVYATSLDLQSLIRQSDRVSEAQLEGARGQSAVFSRPQLDADYVGPRDDVEEQLVAMWADLLGIDQVGVHDDFFDLGGHSLIAVRLFAQVKRVFSVDFPISVLVEAPTVEACARLIAAARPEGEREGAASSLEVTQPRFRHLVPMHPGEGSTETPMFMVAGMFGNVLNLRHLAHQIGTDRPFYGVQAKGIFGEAAPHSSFEEMARDYLEEVRRVQPVGPYLLGGYSGGGVTAFEMSQQLVEAGEEVALLVMLDTPVPEPLGLTPRERAQIQIDRLRDRGPAYVAQWARHRVEHRRRTAERAEEAAQDAADDGALHDIRVELAFYEALERYRGRDYPGAITLFRPKLVVDHDFGEGRMLGPGPHWVYDDNGWGRHCSDVRVREVPGDHGSMVLEPAVRVLARQIRAAILDATQSSSPFLG